MSKLQKETMNESPDLSKIGQKPSMQEQMRTFPRLARMAYQADPSSFVLMILGLLVETPVSALVVYSTARIIDVLGGADPASAWFWIIVLIVTWFVKNASDVLYVDRLEHVRQKLVITLEDRLLTHMSKLSYGVLEDSSFQSLAMVINRRQHQAIVAFENVIDFLAHVAGLIGMFTVVFYVPWPVAIILIIATAIRFHSSQKLSILNWESSTLRREKAVECSTIAIPSRIRARSCRQKAWGLRMFLSASGASSRASFWKSAFRSAKSTRGT
jgi:ABC-type multidrug transport system fused ATPase/permease subunit